MSYCREEAVQEESRKTSRDGLNEYIWVGSPGLLIIICALSLVLVATVVWGFIGRIPVTTDVTGCVVDSEIAKRAQEEVYGIPPDQKFENAWVVCFIDASKFSADRIMHFNNDVAIHMPDNSTFTGTIEFLSAYPLSRDEARAFLTDSEWVVERCAPSDYSWAIGIRVEDDIANHLFTTPQVTMTTDEVPPISLLTR